MWVDKKEYFELRDAKARLEGENGRMSDMISDLQVRVHELKQQVDAERGRAEAAVDEMMKVNTLGLARPVSTESRNRMDITSNDNMLEEEDPARLKKLHEAIEQGADLMDLLSDGRDF